MIRVDLIGFVTAGVAALFLLGHVEPAVLLRILGVIAQVGGTLLGFIVAAMAILMALPDSRFTRNLRKTGHMQALLRQMFWTAVWSLALILISLLAMFAPEPSAEYAAAISIAILGGTVARLLVTGNRFYLILEILSEQESNDRLE